MSLQAENKRFKNELTAGVHLVSIFDIKMHKDSNKQPIQRDGEIAILLTFVTGTNPNLYHEQIYWIGKGREGKEKYFTQMCLDAGIDMSVAPMPKKAALNKRLWIGVRDVFTLVNNGSEVKKDMLGNDVIERFIFHTAPVWDVEKPPTWKGDPKFNDGIACDDFVGYVEDNEDGYETMPKGEAVPFTLEVAQVTPEIEKAVVVEVKPKKATKKAKSLVETIAPMQEVKDIEEYQKQKVGDLSLNERKEKGLLDNVVMLPQTTTTTAMPNFWDATPTTEQEQTIESVMKNVDMSQMVVIQPQATTITEMPNFGDSETPDTNF